MSKTIKTLTLLLFVWLRVVSALYKIPDAQIEVYYPRGLRVLIPDARNVQLFAFHGNINRLMRDYEVGQYYKDVLHPINGSWIYEDRVVRLRPGDRLYYWLYVLHDGLGYRKDNQVFLIDDVINGKIPDLPAPSEQNLQQSTESNLIASSTEKQSNTLPTMVQRNDDDLQMCNQLVVNLTRSLIKAQVESEAAKETSGVLAEMLQRRADYKKLTMRGRLSLTEAPIAVVQLVLREKLSLQPNVVNAERQSDHSITFELADLQQTVEVIATAKDKLANSTAVSITY